MKKPSHILLHIMAPSILLLNACSGLPTSSSDEAENANEAAVTQASENVNSNDTNSSDANSNDANSNGSDGNANDSGIELFGVVEAITDDTITINGVTYLLASFTEFKDLVAVGDEVKVHIIINADGTFTIREIEISSGLGGDNSNDNDSNDANSNDDNGIDANSNDDNGNGANSNDDNGNGGNSNDDNGGDGNDNGGGGNDNGNDDNSNG